MTILIMLQCGYIAERYGRAYDISTPIGAYNYATFLSFVANVHAAKLLARVKGVSEEIVAKVLRDDESLKWTMEHQFAAAVPAK